MAKTLDEVIRRLASIVENELPVQLPSGRADPSANLRRDLGLDSVLILDLIGVIEEKFGFEFEESELEPGTFETIATLAEVIQKRVT